MRAVLALTVILGCLLAAILAVSSESSGVSFGHGQPTIFPPQEQPHPMTKELVEGCMKENGVTAQDLSDLQTGKVKPQDAKDNVKCSTQCVLVKSGFMDATGKLLTESIKKIYNGTPLQAQVDKDLDKCSKIKGANACDTAYQMLSCFHGDVKNS
ncbi:hypothetical protein KR018_001023 [Drosophila ironensis]|nr:hypothetical protein KR018_001023 [Drosophila ironensis]